VSNLIRANRFVEKNDRHPKAVGLCPVLFFDNINAIIINAIIIGLNLHLSNRSKHRSFPIRLKNRALNRQLIPVLTGKLAVPRDLSLQPCALRPAQ
jgi:hypothetical protein